MNVCELNVVMEYTDWILVFGYGYMLNVVWEYLHFSLYITTYGPFPIIFLASFVDAVSILFAFVVSSYVISQSSSFSVVRMFLFVVLLLLLSYLYEMIGLSLGWWMYKDVMPVILGKGVSPLLQLSITGLATVFLTHVTESLSSDD